MHLVEVPRDDLIRSNSIEYDKLIEMLIPLNGQYEKLVNAISERTGGHYREIFISLWQLQIFNRLTIQIVKQLTQCKIPVVKFLMEHHGFAHQKDLLSGWSKQLEEKNISGFPPATIYVKAV